MARCGADAVKRVGRLSTHVLDTASGRPAGGVRIELSMLDGERWRRLKTVQTNAEGRTDEPLLAGDELQAGRYELLFHIGDYFGRGAPAPVVPFLDAVPVRFAIADAGAHYHIPLLCTPWSYATYRGS